MIILADPPTYLVYTNLALLGAATYMAGLHAIYGRPADRSHARRLHLAAFISLSFTLVAILWAFLTSNFDYAYVVEHSATTTPTIYKISGLWAGREGTLVLWTWAALGAMGLEDLRFHWRLEQKEPARKNRSRGRKGQSLRGNFFGDVRVIGLLFILAMALIQLALNPFAPREVPVPADQDLPLNFEGYGLNPLLQTPWMAIHPPIIFLSYGLMIPVLAAGLAYLISHKRAWVEIALRWARWSWVGMGASLALGGYWAYVTLGWGGYWAWDPVETASLLPWIGLTAFLHIALMFRKKDNYQVLGPLLASLVVALTIFESFVTRGGIWVSVHSFGDFQDPQTAWVRFTNVLQDDRSVLGFFIMLLSVTALTIALTLRAISIWPPPEAKPKQKLADYLDDETTMYATVYALLLLLAITMVLLLIGVNGTLEPAIFNSRLTPLMMVVTAIFLITNLRHIFEPEQVLYISGGVVLLAILGGVVGSRMEGGDVESLWLLGAALPAAIASIVAILWQLHRLRGQPLFPYPKDATPWTVHLIHAGMVLILLGYAANTGLSNTESGMLFVTPEDPEPSAEISGYTITINDLPSQPVIEDEGRILRYVVELTISKGGKELGTGQLALVNHTNAYTGSWQITAELFILHRLHEDVYLILDTINFDDQRVKISVKVVPYINLVWVGTVMILVGEIIIMGLEWPPLRNRVREFYRKRHPQAAS